MADSRLLAQGTTEDGREIIVREDYDAHRYGERLEVLVNGLRVRFTEEPMRFRDGGTTVMHTTEGIVVVPSRLKGDRPCTIDGAPFLPGHLVEGREDA